MNESGGNEVLRRTTRITVAGLILNIFLSGSKLAGGILSNSHALMADGVHSLSDCVTDMAILVGAKYWTKPSDLNHPHGHARIETIISGFIGGFITLTGLYIAWQSFRAIMVPAETPPGWTAFAIAVISILAKGVLSRWTLKTSRKLKSPALAANAMHQRSDAVSSIPVAVVVLAARLNGSLVVMDGIGGAIVSIFILKLGINIIRPVLWQLSDIAAPPEIVDELRKIALSVPGVKDVHNLRTRYQSDGIQTDMHIVVDGQMPLEEAFSILKKVEWNLYHIGPGVVDVMVRLEPD
jgi:cation diffusion facilitator family transporter